MRWPDYEVDSRVVLYKCVQWRVNVNNVWNLDDIIKHRWNSKVFDVFIVFGQSYKDEQPRYKCCALKAEQMYLQHQWTKLHKETPRYLHGSERRSSPTSTGSNQSLMKRSVISEYLTITLYRLWLICQEIQCDTPNILKFRYD